MAKLTTKKRKALKKSQFGLPKQRGFPIPDASHARNAKARAAEMYNKGKLTKGQELKIDSRADKVIAEAHKKRKK